MTSRPAIARFIVVLVVAWALGSPIPAWSQTTSAAATAPRKEGVMPHRATGSFEVTLTPQVSEPGLGHARMSISKQFHGDLEATSKGEMLAAGTAEKGSAGYVALESVTGSLHGRAGTFVLQHSGTMERGTAQLTVKVVPDSGTGALKGLAGSMTIEIEAGKHSYDFRYTLAEGG